jgi:transaldolase
MNIFLDTAYLDEIKQALDWGVLDGVTTNPTHIARTGRPHHQVVEEICRLFAGPVCAETTGTQTDGIVNQARELAAIHPSVVVSVPLRKEGLKAVKLLAEEGIRCSVTVAFTPMQALLAAKAGAFFVSPVVERLDRIGADGFEVVEKIKKIFVNYRYSTKLLVAGIRSPLTVLEAALAGADVCTMPFEVLSMLYQHPLTEQGINIFLKDAATIPTDPNLVVPPARPKEDIREREFKPREEMPRAAAAPAAEPPKAAAAADLSRTPAPLHITPSKTPPAIIMRRSNPSKSGAVPVVKADGQELPPSSDPSIATPEPDSSSSGSAGPS